MDFVLQGHFNNHPFLYIVPAPKPPSVCYFTFGKIFGINEGRLGFLTEVSPEEAIEGLERIINEDYFVEERRKQYYRVLADSVQRLQSDSLTSGEWVTFFLQSLHSTRKWRLAGNENLLTTRSVWRPSSPGKRT